jgi:hypothetical protein
MIEYSEHWLTLSEVGGGNLIEVNRVCRLCIDNKQGRASSDKYCSTSAPPPPRHLPPGRRHERHYVC